MLKLPLYDGYETEYEDIIYQYFRKVLGEQNYILRIKRSGYQEIDGIVPSAASGRIGNGSCDAYILSNPSSNGFCGLVELETTGKLENGIQQIKKYAKGFVSKKLSKEQQETVKNITSRSIKLIVFDGKTIYLSEFNLETSKEKIIYKNVPITTSNTDEINATIMSFFPKVSDKDSKSEDNLIRSTAKIIRGHEKIQKNKALVMTLLASIYGATGEIKYKESLDIIKKSQSDYDKKLHKTYTELLKEISDENDEEKLKELYEEVAIHLYDLSRDQGMDLYGYIYEELASKESKKEQGEYYTPRHTIRPILKSVFENYLEWKKDELVEKIVFDPFCGSGGFLYEYIEIIKKKFSLKMEEIDKIAKESLWGSDKNSILGAYLNLFLIGDGSANIQRVKTSINWRKYFIYKNGKNKPERLRDDKEIKLSIKQNLGDINYHLKMFAGQINVSEKDIEKFVNNEDSPVDAMALDKLGLRSSIKDERYLGNVDLLITNVPYGSITEQREQFIEAGIPKYGLSLEANALRECIDYLKPEEKKSGQITQKGGVCIAIVPDSILENPTNKPIRDYLITRCEILAIVGLPPFTFSPYAMEKTYALVFKKLAPEDFNCNRNLSSEVFMYDSISDGKANSVNRYETNHIEFYEVKDYNGNIKNIQAYLHNDFDPFFESLGTNNYLYLSKLEWAWKRDFSNSNPNWDQEKITETWTKSGWKKLPGRKWGYMPLQRFKRQLQKEIKSENLYEKIKTYLDDEKVELDDFCENFVFYKEEILNSEKIDLSSNEQEKLVNSTFIDINESGDKFILYKNIEIDDVDMNPSSYRYLGIQKQTIIFENHVDDITLKTFSSIKDIIQEFSHDFTSDSLRFIRLGTEFDVLQGTQFSKVDAYNYPGEIAVFTAATNGPAYYVNDNIKGKTKIYGPALIWSRKGAKAGTIQKYDAKDKENNYYPFFISDVSGTISPKKGKEDMYDLDFLMVYIAGQVRNERTSTANNAQLNKSKIENLKIYLPDIDIQNKIGEIVRSIKDVCY